MAPAPAAPAHHERLWPGPLGWAGVVGFALVAGVAIVLVDLVAAVVVAVVVLVVGVVAAVLTSPVVAVGDGELRAGRAHIPVALLGRGEVLDQAGVRQALGPGSDARTYACLRTWTHQAVLLEVTDPEDRTPSWLVSSRRANALLAAVRAEQGGQGRQAAHSEQIG